MPCACRSQRVYQDFLQEYRSLQSSVAIKADLGNQEERIEVENKSAREKKA